MSGEILNNKTLWQEFYSNLELNPTVLEETVEGDIKTERVRFRGRALYGERVNIYAVYMHGVDDGKRGRPALLLLGDCGCGIDLELMKKFCSLGYAVLMPDYDGKKEFSTDYTVYPESLSYANYEQAKTSLYVAKNGARKTCWFEWCCVARFSYEYLKSVSGKAKIGAVGIKGGGEILLKVLPACSDIKCAVTVNAFGWLSYRGVNKFEKDSSVVTKLSVNDAWLNYLSALDSQCYAPYITTPVLFVCTNHDRDVDMDRVYDTFARLRSKEDSALLYGVRHNGRVGKSGMNDITMFLSKYMYDREVYVPEVARLDIKVDEDGDLVCVVRFDELGEVENYGVLCSEDTLRACDREWTIMPHKRTLDDGSEVYYLNVTDIAKTIYVCVFEKYTNGFTSNSRIVPFDLSSVKFKNKVVRERVIYPSDTESNGIYRCESSKSTIAHFFIKDFAADELPEAVGYGGIKGLLCDGGVILYRAGMTRFSPDDDSVLSLDLCCAYKCKVLITARVYSEGDSAEFCYQVDVDKSERWKKRLLSADEFTDGQNCLKSFKGLVSLTVFAEVGSGALINNVAWI